MDEFEGSAARSSGGFDDEPMPGSEAIGTMRTRIRDAQRLTTASLSDARGAIDRVARAAEQNVRDIHASLSKLSGDSTSGSIAKSVAELDGVVTSYLDLVTRESEAQQELAARAAARCREIMAAVDEIDRVAFAAKLLSLNAIIKSESVSHGQALSVIAMNMASLTAQLTSLNSEVATLGRALVAVLPEMAEHARAIRDESVMFLERFRVTIASLAPRAKGLRASVDDVLAAGEQRLKKILGEADRAQKALGFEAEFLRSLEGLERYADRVEESVASLARGDAAND